MIVSLRTGERFGAGARAAEWDARYSERDGAMWRGPPNGRLVAEAADLTSGRALEIVGCGEGADAIWLAWRGWTVTGIELRFGRFPGAGGSRTG